MSIVGDDDRSTLQGVLRTQQLFRQNVHHYIITNLWQIKRSFQVLIQPPEEETENVDNEQSATTSFATADTDVSMEEAEDGQIEEKQDDAMGSQEEGTVTQEDDTHDENSPPSPPSESYSMREWFHDLQDDDGEPLIHAIYPSIDENKVYLLCEKQRTVKVLKLIHNLVDIAGMDFPEEALLVYFGANKQNLSVHNYPRTTPQTTAYSTHLAAYATASNPQDEMPSSQLSAQNDIIRNTKRTRDGEMRATTMTSNQSYAGATQGHTQAPSSTVYDTDIKALLARLNNNLQNLEEVDRKQQINDVEMKKVEQRFAQVESVIA